MSKLQTEIACSTLEAEYIALAQAMRDLIPIHRSFEKLCLYFKLVDPNDSLAQSTIFEDNSGAISTATTPKMTPRTKHIGVKCHFVKDYFAKKRNPDHHPFDLKKIDTLIQKADIFTKGLDVETLKKLCLLLCGW